MVIDDGRGLYPLDLVDARLDEGARVHFLELDPASLYAHGGHPAHDVRAVVECHAVADVKICHVPQSSQSLHMASS
jgi:hypothetical protein